MRLWRGWVPVLLILGASMMAILPWMGTKLLAVVLFVALIVMVLGGVFTDSDQSATDAEPRGPECPACGYDLRASKERCPECGMAIPPLDPMVRSPMLVRVLERAESLAREMGLDHVGTEHVLVAMFGERESVAAVVLGELGVEEGDVREHVAAVNHFVIPVDQG